MGYCEVCTLRGIIADQCTTLGPLNGRIEGTCLHHHQMRKARSWEGGKADTISCTSIIVQKFSSATSLGPSGAPRSQMNRHDSELQQLPHHPSK